MAAVCPSQPFCVFSQHELPVHSADDPASRQQKMVQQRQLALKRQRDLTKSSFGGVVAADTPSENSPAQKKALGWGKMLGVSIEVEIEGAPHSADKLPLDSASGLVRIRVPRADEESCPILTQSALEACHDTCPVVTQPPREVVQDAGHTPSGGYVKHEDGQTSSRPLLPATDSCWDLQIEVKTQEKARGRKLWRPWGSSKRNNAVTETAIEEMKVGATEDGEIIVEEHRVSIACPQPESGEDRCTAMSIGRAATPWQQPGNESVLEESFGSDLSSIPGFAECEGNNQDESLECVENASFDRDEELIDKDHDDSADSGIEQTVSEWKEHEKHRQSPIEKRSRFNRFIPTMNAPKLWRTPKATPNLVTRIDVIPATEID